METKQVKTTALTFGRFQLPHPGHVSLVQKMLDEGDLAVVGVSTAAKNNSFEGRVGLLKGLCEKAGLPMDRIEFVGASSPYSLVEGHISDDHTGLIDLEAWNTTTVILGIDQAKLGMRLRDDIGVAFVPNEVRVGSSTVIRYFLEQGDEQFVREIYHNDPELFDTVLSLRQEELSREKS